MNSVYNGYRTSTMWNLQRYECSFVNAFIVSDDPQEMEVFKIDAGETLNLVELLHNDCELRWCMQLWDSQPSEVNGCIQLYRPRAPKPELYISNARFPILGLLDALHQAGRIAVPRLVVHSIRGGPFFRLNLYAKPMVP